jgi:hypothetical protein
MFNGKYEDNYKPKLTVFSVNKKTDLKFFEKHNGGYRNIPSGTVIDSQVMSPGVFEFYLQCPEVDRGTGSPVHFLCLHSDNEELTVNDFEEITYKQSFYEDTDSWQFITSTEREGLNSTDTICDQNGETVFYVYNVKDVR